MHKRKARKPTRVGGGATGSVGVRMWCAPACLKPGLSKGRVGASGCIGCAAACMRAFALRCSSSYFPRQQAGRCVANEAGETSEKGRRERHTCICLGLGVVFFNLWYRHQHGRSATATAEGREHSIGPLDALPEGSTAINTADQQQQQQREREERGRGIALGPLGAPPEGSTGA